LRFPNDNSVEGCRRYLRQPDATNPLGVKGVGEAGTTASLAAVMNAVADAIPRTRSLASAVMSAQPTSQSVVDAHDAGANIDMPATPERVWRALSAHGGGT
jgi:carbon-monoxide dehydrogenase large subunit